jgi:hypothetical protein
MGSGDAVRRSGRTAIGVDAWLRVGRRRALFVLAVIAAELAIALPFLVIEPSDIRGVPGPLLVVVGVASSYLLGPRLGVALTVLAVVLAVWIVGENAYTEPLLWIPIALGAGIVGDRGRRGDELRRELLGELRRGLVAVEQQPRAGPLRVLARYVPVEQAQVLAGDFYGALVEPGGAVAVMVGDVAGHGPGAAAVAARLRAAWRGLTSAGVSAVETMRVLNETLIAERRRNPDQVPFATLCLASIDLPRSEARFVIAGHPSPIILTDAGASEITIPADPAIGFLPDVEWHARVVELPQRSWTLLLFTDGLIEGRVSPHGPRPLGADRLMTLLAERGAPLEEADVDTVLAAVETANGGPMTDDIVLVAVSPADA